jgi:hypothetical protein
MKLKSIDANLNNGDLSHYWFLSIRDHVNIENKLRWYIDFVGTISSFIEEELKDRYETEIVLENRS